MLKYLGEFQLLLQSTTFLLKLKMSLIVQVEQGKLQGKEIKNVLTGKPFYSFQGIPYAEKPLRFQVAETKKRWEGIYDATYERDICIQKDAVTSVIGGSENCLHINVFTPEIPDDSQKIKIFKPVMVHIHGGGFFCGSASEDFKSADFLIRHDVVIVTFNYRLNVFGFLNLGLPDCPGNVGLKDQSLALHWVNKNIESFGGDPKNITILGQSAGGTSVHYHTISPLSKGLFQKAIMESGLALSFWGFVQNPYEMAFKFGEELGFKGEDKQELLKFLQQQEAGAMIRKFVELHNKTRKQYPFAISDIVFGPSVEAIKDGAFLPDLPEKVMIDADPVPIICGAASKDGILIHLLIPPESIDLMEDDFSTVLKDNFIVEPQNEIVRLSKKIKDYYFGNKQISLDTVNEISTLFTDLFFYSLYESVENVVKSSCPVYVYEFDYVGGLNFMLERAQNRIPTKLEGACHSDQSGYLFYQRTGDSIPHIKGDDLKVVNDITKLWTNFAKCWKLPNEFGWKPSTETEPSFLRISAKSKVIKGTIFGERMQFLKHVLAPYAKPEWSHNL